MKKDWTGNSAGIFKSLGATNHANSERAKQDFYATDPLAIDKLASKFDIPHIVLEPCCGQGHLSKRLKELGHEVWSYDIVDRGYGGVQNFFEMLTLPDSLTLSLCKIDVCGDHQPSLQVCYGSITARIRTGS